MKAKLFAAVLILSTTTLYNQTVSAQISKTSVKFNRSSTYMAANTTPADKIESYILNDSEAYGADMNEAVAKLNRRALYMVSEQFVFDNLSSLKKTFAIADIYFDLDDAIVRPDALPVLNNLVNMMKDNPEINVAATAYSDSRMSKYNEKLANSRAQAAINYLIAQGISAGRLVIEKHGRPEMANPCNNDPSCSLATQQLNRRTEFNIVYNGINLGHVN